MFLSDEQWEKLAPLFDKRRGPIGRSHRDFVEAVLWYAQSGKPWRRMPKYYGDWNSVYVRFHRWDKLGLWRKVFDILKNEPGFAERYLDPEIIASHQRRENLLGRRTGIAAIIKDIVASFPEANP
jgi:putative transposase